MPSYTNVAKPTSTPYTKVNSYLPSYDEPSIAFDDAATYYDGLNSAAYSNVAKPTSSVYTLVNKPST